VLVAAAVDRRGRVTHVGRDHCPSDGNGR
jgi:hypothetical protein